MGCSASKSTLIDGQKLEEDIHNKFGPKKVSTHDLSTPKSSRSRKSSSSSNSSNGSVKSSKKKPTLVTKEMIVEFQSTSHVIQRLEKKKTHNLLESALKKQTENLNDLKLTEQQHEDLQAKTKKEHADVVSLKEMKESSSVSQYFGSTEHFDQQLSKEEEEYIEAKTEEENCHKKLLELREQQTKINAQVEALTADQQQLTALYEQQDQTLERIFDGKYGSDLEQQLEEESDEIENKLERVELIMQQWTQAEASADAATRQLDYACKRWQDVMKINNASYAQVRMQAMTETRNYLLAAQGNLVAVQRLVKPVQVPYCNEDETKTLGKAINFIFIDAMSHDRQHHALNVYRTTQQRSVMLLRWVTAVRTNKIAEDSSQLRAQNTEVNKKLRAERIRLMTEKVKEQTGQSIDIVDEDDDDDDAADDIKSALVIEASPIDESDGLQERIKEATDKKMDEGGDGDAEETGESLIAAATGDDDKPKSLDELAPQPTKNELFGDLDSIMAEYKNQQNMLVSEQEAARARQQSDFKEKLRRRKSRKMKKQALENATTSS